MRPFSANLAVVGLALASLISVAACAGGTEQTPSTSPSATSAPTASPVTPAPSSPVNQDVSLAVATENEVVVTITDASGKLQGAVSGTPGDGASVEPYTVTVVNDDPSTLRLTWSGGPCDATDSLSIDEMAQRFLIVEPECPGDAVAFDRILVLHFSEPIDANSTEARLQDGLDTAG